MAKMSALVKHIRPTDFPRTEARTAYAIKESLARQFNYARQHPTQMEALKAQLQFVLSKVATWEQNYEALKLVSAAQGKDIETKTTKFAMSGGGARNIQPAQPYLMRKDGSTPTAKPFISSDVRPTGVSVPATGSVVKQMPPATIHNNMGHGFINISKNGNNTTINEAGVVSAITQTVPKTVTQTPVKTVDITQQLQRPEQGLVLPPP